MASSCRLIENIAGRISKSNLAKVGLGESVNMFLENQQNSDEKSTNILMRTVMGEVKAADITGKCRGMYRVSRGYDNRPVLYTVYNHDLYLINQDNTVNWIANIPSVGSECHMTETGGYGSAHPHLIIVDGTAVYAVNTGLPIPDQQMDFRTIKLPVRVNTDNKQINPTHCAYLYGYLIVNDAGTDAFYTSYQYPFEISDTQPESFYADRAAFVAWWMTLDDSTREQYRAGEIQDSYYSAWKSFIDGTADDTPEEYDLFRVDTVEFAKYGFVTYSEWCPDNTIALRFFFLLVNKQLGKIVHAAGILTISDTEFGELSIQNICSVSCGIHPGTHYLLRRLLAPGDILSRVAVGNPVFRKYGRKISSVGTGVGKGLLNLYGTYLCRLADLCRVCHRRKTCRRTMLVYQLRNSKTVCISLILYLRCYLRCFLRQFRYIREIRYIRKIRHIYLRLFHLRQISAIPLGQYFPNVFTTVYLL